MRRRVFFFFFRRGGEGWPLGRACVFSPFLSPLSPPHPLVGQRRLVEAGHGGRGVEDVGDAGGFQGGQVAGGADGAWEGVRRKKKVSEVEEKRGAGGVPNACLSRERAAGGLLHPQPHPPAHTPGHARLVPGGGPARGGPSVSPPPLPTVCALPPSLAARSLALGAPSHTPPTHTHRQTRPARPRPGRRPRPAGPGRPPGGAGRPPRPGRGCRSRPLPLCCVGGFRPGEKK